MLYIMRAYHLYDEHKSLKLGHLIQDLQGTGGSIIFAKRSRRAYGSLEDYTSTVIINHAFTLPRDYVLEEATKYTIDTGLGHTHKGYPIVVEGYVNIDANGQLVNARGNVPWIDAEFREMPEHLNLQQNVSAWVFK